MRARLQGVYAIELELDDHRCPPCTMSGNPLLFSSALCEDWRIICIVAGKDKSCLTQNDQERDMLSALCTCWTSPQITHVSKPPNIHPGLAIIRRLAESKKVCYTCRPATQEVATARTRSRGIRVAILYSPSFYTPYPKTPCSECLFQIPICDHFLFLLLNFLLSVSARSVSRSRAFLRKPLARSYLLLSSSSLVHLFLCSSRSPSAPIGPPRSRYRSRIQGTASAGP